MPGTAGSAPTEVPVTSASWKEAPNYAINRATDSSILTDGKVSRDPIWVRSGTAVWVRQTPVSLSLRLAAALDPNLDYSLQLHLGEEFRSGVKPLRRVDLYCMDSSNKTSMHAGAIDTVTEAQLEEASGWIDIFFSGCHSDSVDVILHANGRFLAMDEIKVLGAVAAPVVSSAGEIITAQTDTRVDSIRRLQSSMLAKRRSLFENALAEGNIRGSDAWFAPPWDRLDLSDGITRRFLGDGKTARLIAGDGLPATVVVGVRNATPQPKVFSLRFADHSPLIRLAARALEPVLAADGRYVFDAIGDNSSSITVAPYDIGYFWISASAAAASEDIDLVVSDNTDWSETLALNIRTTELTSSAISDFMPKALVWSYSSDAPIWSTPPLVADQLEESGVNVFVVHPSSIPKLTDPSTLQSRKKRLQQDLQLYRGRGTVLLFVNWRRELQGKDMSTPAFRQQMKIWLTNIAGILESQGFSKNEWAVYPVDEPRGRSLELAAESVFVLKELDPEIQVYLNPIAPTPRDFKYRSLIQDLAKTVDIWQPRRGPGYEVVQAALLDSNAASRQLWMYDNPRSPAKSELPLCYRAIGWRAFEMGATGVGFWSYSATDGSSAWNDFDGRGPDWAVAYESESGPQSSRRWEAFKTGLREYAMLRYCNENEGRNFSACNVLHTQTTEMGVGVCP